MAAFDWRRGLVVTHRWLGIAGGIFFVVWFASGIVMIYRRMPALDSAERWARLAPLDAASVRVAPAAAARVLGAPSASVAEARLGMHDGRPVYRFGARGAVFADTGEPLAPLSAADAENVARRFAPEHATTTRHDRRLEAPDQWTLQIRAHLPLHRVALGDAEGTELYVSERTGEVAMETKRTERAWAYVGPVLHWLYFTPLRARSELWAQAVIWLSVAGCVLALSGLLWGMLRFRGGSPYAGLLRWHHYTGLAFGLFAFTWTLSGGLSMDPWSWHPGTAPTRAQREGASGGPLRAEEIGADDVRSKATALVEARAERGAPTKELGFLQLLGVPYLVALAGGGVDGAPRFVALTPDARPFARFTEAQLRQAAHEAMPGVAVVDERWLEAYDSYYYARSSEGLRTLPVLRVRYADPRKTWLYLDPALGAIVRKEETLTRLNRWLYHGLHSLDVPFLYGRRPLWDVVVIGLSLGGLALAGSTLLPGWRRLARALSGARARARSRDRSSRRGTSR
jgi:hypothetical protein